MSDREVLVLDPDAATRSRIRKTLEGLDIDCVAYGDVTEALRYGNWSGVAAVIANMKTLSGPAGRGKRGSATQLRREIERLREAGSASPRPSGRPRAVIVTTDDFSTREHEAAIDAGAGLYLAEDAAFSKKIMRRYIGELLRTRQGEDTHGRSPEARDPVFALPSAHLRSASGRLSADRIADELGTPLKSLAEAVGAGYTTVQKTPDSAALQTRLAPFANVLVMLHDVFEGDQTRIRVWLSAEHRLLGGKPPLAVMLTPGAIAGVEQMVSNAWQGVPA